RGVAAGGVRGGGKEGQRRGAGGDPYRAREGAAAAAAARGRARLDLVVVDRAWFHRDVAEGEADIARRVRGLLGELGVRTGGGFGAPDQEGAAAGGESSGPPDADEPGAVLGQQVRDGDGRGAGAGQMG